MDTQPDGLHGYGGDPGRLPPRSRQLVDELRVLTHNWLHEPIRQCLGHFDARLRNLAGHARSHLDQQGYAASRQRLIERRQAFDQGFGASIDDAFVRLGRPGTTAGVGARPTLGLLDTLDHELAVALDQLVARSEVRGGLPMVELGYRLAVLYGEPPFRSDALPVGPQAMARAFRDACRAMRLPGQHELLLLQSLESSLMHSLSPLHELLNAHLQSQGILPHLRTLVLPRIARGGHHPARKDAFALPLQAPPEAAPAPAAAAGSPHGHARTASGEELQATLFAVQRHLARMDRPHRNRLRAARHLRDELLLELNAANPDKNARIHLSPAQDDTLDLIARLFGQIMLALPKHPVARQLFGDLQLPMLRAALAEPRCLRQHEHPVRMALEAMAELVRDWLDDSDDETNRVLLERLAHWVDQAGQERPDAALYANLLGEVKQLSTWLQQTTQIARRRQAKAMRGLEQLEDARQHAAALIAARAGRAAAQHARLRLLDTCWPEVLALTLLQHGEKSEAMAARLSITDQLLGRLPIADQQQLRADIETCLRHIGMTAGQAAQTARTLAHKNASASGADAVMQPESTPAPGGAPSPRNRFMPGSKEWHIHRHLRTLPMGTWFEFLDFEGHIRRRQLAWYSPMTGHSLFVAHDGQRAEELEPLQLAHEIVLGRVREAPRHPDDILDRAWLATVRARRNHAPRTGGSAS